ncbi:MAG: restriction endonuclease subunit S [Rhodocyclales bacterium]|nr:restriction endonuclease subunit S [Rhodocyclales bacterium]
MSSSSRQRLKSCSLGDVIVESTERARSSPENNLRVYGVDRAVGLTPDPKYSSADLSRYKILRPQFFAYNPMRLNIGSIAYCSEKHSVGLVSPDYVVFGCQPGKLDPMFASYLINGPEWRKWTTAAGVGSVRVRIYFRELARMPVTLPPIAEQKAIAAVLRALDDKIELNRRMNATLEAMARALFQSWFVDFDPVRAKLDGRKPVGLDAATAALFPATFQDSKAGHIPHGWSAQRLPDAIEVNPRRTLKGGTIAPYLDMKNLPTQGHSAEEVIDREFSSGTKFQNGDTLLARITPCLENGKTGYVDFLEDGQVGWGSTEYIVLAPKPPLPPQFGYLLARSDALRSHAIRNMTGTSGRQRVPSECFNSLFLAVPTPAVARRFDELTAPLMSKIKANSNQSRTLATLRDTLLPKLLSGEVPLNEN